MPETIYTVEDFHNAVDSLAKFSAAMPGDNAGLLAGSRKLTVKAALVALDATESVLAEAVELGADLLITHHPIIYPSVKKVEAESLLYKIISAGVSVICAHTNLDAAQDGVNDSLAARLGLTGVSVLESEIFPGLARIGALERPMSPADFAKYIKERLNAGCIRFTQGGESVRTVAVGGGSCAELWQEAKAAGAQAFVTAEVRHHQFIEAANAGYTLLDAGHYATEAVVVEPFAKRLMERLPGAGIFISESQADPAHYI